MTHPSAAYLYACQVCGVTVAEKLAFYAERDGLDFVDLARKAHRIKCEARQWISRHSTRLTRPDETDP